MTLSVRRPSARALAAFVLLVFAALAGEAVRAQQQVVVVLTRPPVGRLGVSDLYRLQAISPQGPATVTFRGTLSEARTGLLYEVATDRVELRQGANPLRVSDLEPIRVVTEPRDSRLREALVRTGEPPAGDYEVCVYALDAASGAELGRDCYTQAIDPLSPPLLISPGDGEQVTVPLVTFVWTPPVPVPRGRLTYAIRVAEMLTGQVPELAARSNPSVFETDRLTTTTLVYPTSARPLRPGRYAWTVTALVDGRAVGQSEAGAFAIPARVPLAGSGTVVLPPSGPPLPGPVTPVVTPPIATAPVLITPLTDARLTLGQCTSQCDPLTDPAVTVAVGFGGPVPGQAAGSSPGQTFTLPPGGVLPGAGTFRVSPDAIRIFGTPGGATGGSGTMGGPITIPQTPVTPGSMTVPPRVVVPPPGRP